MEAQNLVRKNVEERTNHPLSLNLPALKILDCARETVGLRERTNDLVYYKSVAIVRKNDGSYFNLVREDLRWWPRNSSCIFVHSVYEESSSTSYVVDGILNDGFNTSCLYHNVETVWIILLDLFPLGLGACPISGRSAKLLSNGSGWDLSSSM